MALRALLRWVPPLALRTALASMVLGGVLGGGLLSCHGKAERAAMRVPAHADPAANVDGKKALTEPHALQHCFPDDRSIDPPRPLDALLDRAAERYDASDFIGSLACAEEAARLDSRSVEAQHDRGSALAELNRLPEAEEAFVLALALDPDDAETLAGAADLFINRLSPSLDHTETGLELARRGSRRVRRDRMRDPGERALGGRLALLEGQSLNDLGRSREALTRLDAAVTALPNDEHVRYERAVALFDLCRFPEAKRAFEETLQRDPTDAWAHHHLGLTLERLGQESEAEQEMKLAESEAPDDFKEPVELSPLEFRKLVDKEAAQLPPALIADLARVRLETADVPDLSDLIAEEPPLQPTILGLFRGAPLGEAPATEPRTIVIYRKNLARAVADKEELISEVRTTLLHELGHLRGEDDDELRARGLE